ncbi:MAG TPA: glycosyltransferase family 2 protein [Caldimonas sp.]|nr:glycosyltransferase family 2 protein [Caldimonas sp.]
MTAAASLALVGQVLTVIAIVALVPASVLLVEVLAALVPARRDDDAATAVRPRVVVLVPAHDEANGIAATVRTIAAQLGVDDRVVVVADNCSDATAEIAAANGAEVVVRNDGERRGKGYALDFGVRHLERSPPEVVVVVDADCELHPGGVDRLAQQCARTARPAQALDLMRAPAGAGLKARIAEFAWVVKNQVRPLGCHRLGLPCQLMGTGMAFPWRVISQAPLASGHIVEDLRLGLDLAAAGCPPIFCPGALVTSSFPSEAQGVAEQRTRWEHGHVGVILREAPRAFWRSLVRGRPALAAMALDVCVPPLALFVALLVVQAAVDVALVAVGGSAVALVLALAALATVAAATLLAWLGFGRRIVSFAELLGAPLYVLAKLPLYARFLRRGKREWVRARRDHRHD